MIPFIKKYEPSKSSQIKGQDKSVETIKNHIKNHKQGQKALLLHGPPGVGKTSAVHAIAKELDMELLEVNASDYRNKQSIEELLGANLKQQSLFMKQKLILVDEVDGLSGRDDRGGAGAVASLIEKSSFPIILTAQDPWKKSLKAVRKKSELVQFHSLNYLSIFNVLKSICEEEKIQYNETDLKTLARRAGGDLRAAINDLQSLTGDKGKLTKESIESLGEREKTESILNALMKVLKTTDPGIAVRAFDNVNEDLDTCMLWLDENIPKEYEDPEDLAKAYDKLSKADVFNGRIRKWQYWRFLVYYNTLMTAGVAVSKKEKYKKFVSYKPTTRILKLWKAKMMNAKRNAIAEKVAVKTHKSVKDTIKNTMPYIKFIFQNNKKIGEGLAEYYELDKEEVEWLRK